MWLYYCISLSVIAMTLMLQNTSCADLKGIKLASYVCSYGNYHGGCYGKYSIYMVVTL